MFSKERTVTTNSVSWNIEYKYKNKRSAFSVMQRLINIIGQELYLNKMNSTHSKDYTPWPNGINSWDASLV